ncbi:DNA-directed RNA polymerase I subunit rpa49 [Coemansia sp. RSA 1813]|nr:DNA-directed RNA polymerase I subunit rpa49 [Coemansia sp. RSA 1646]KAJ1770529.1 DNA-directed RNA polymerase I subunit rpa49 [Coemansia sp. RSA 1843]KAJ2092933.1 DNA-directed RNA polymerase I subunit rpa49 [Coemansia sp. RSA 986]KAJ2216254.1 DNA-directed RNA polymerase I subunit rpa49 [Coemansia sp. RSA 487]KAJ2570573.1 DNA-directed RNA polymerase I subunit rpa49 [Coemansia sp. RSA 1813]
MGSKRKSMGEDGGKKVSISIDSSKAVVQPVVASFAAAVPPMASSFSTYKSVDKNKSNDCIVVSETEKIEYVGQTFEDNKPLFTGCKYLVGVYDKKTDTVTFRKAPYVRVNSAIKSLKDSTGVVERNMSNRIIQARNELGEAFGNKKRKAQIRAEERNKINMDTVKGDMSIIETSIGLRTSSMPTAEDLKSVEDANRPVPKYDLEATKPEDIYDMDDVLPMAIASHINVTPFTKATDTDEYRQNVPVRSLFVLKKIELTLEQKKPDINMLRRVLYLSYLMKFFTFGSSALKNRDKCAGLLMCAPEVSDQIFEKFTECVAGSVNPDGSPVVTRTPASESKLVCHIAVLMLAANSWVVYPMELSADLGIPAKRAEKFLFSVGCKLEAASADEIAACVLNKRSRAGSSKKAVLKAPIEFPKHSAHRGR